MTDAVQSTCSEHPDRFDCPDALLDYSDIFDEYGIIVHDGGRSTVAIEFCPWCGARLPESQRDHWFATLAALGFDDPWEQEIPEAFQSDAWRKNPARKAKGAIKPVT